MKQNDLIYIGSEGKLAGYDLMIPENFNGTLIYFIHGYKGYKNWGAWDLIADYFYRNGYGFAKCNLSHNGTSYSKPKDFSDLEAFAHNRYSFELADIKSFVNTVDKKINQEIRSRVLIGHSRGGGDVVLSVKHLPNIDVLITWAAISDIGKRFFKGDELNTWKKTGTYSVLNGRTKQMMPHNYSFYEDYLAHKNTLDIQKHASEISIPWAIIHGTADAAVHISEGIALKKASQHAQLFQIDSANHVFGAKEPYVDMELPNHTQELVSITLAFIKKHTS